MRAIERARYGNNEGFLIRRVTELRHFEFRRSELCYAMNINRRRIVRHHRSGGAFIKKRDKFETSIDRAETVNSKID